VVVVGPVPATVTGAMLSRLAGGDLLLVASGVVLVVVGVRVLRPVSESAHRAGEARRKNRPLPVAASAAVGLFTGLLANGGGFLLVPMFLLLFGLTMPEASGTSLAVIAVLVLPTTATHWALGHIDWTVAAALTLGAAPASTVTAAWAHASRNSGGEQAEQLLRPSTTPPTGIVDETYATRDGSRTQVRVRVNGSQFCSAARDAGRWTSGRGESRRPVSEAG
jgi:hypothetical protein